MNAIPEAEKIATLNQAFKEQRLCLFLGAGVSLANGFPSWDQLVLSLYFATISEQNMGGWRPYSNYLYAISKWYLKHASEPLDVIARKVRSFYDDTPKGEKAFFEALSEALYGVGTDMEPDRLLAINKTLESTVNLCKAKHKGKYGVKSVISYNYDSLLEMTIFGKRSAKPIFSKKCRVDDELPIFHVHGYVPFDRFNTHKRSKIVFTEEQYNTVASDPYSWTNIVQLREMSSHVGLMIGLSLTDRNIRRLLDALNHSPVRPNIFALLSRPQKTIVSDDDLIEIHEHAKEIFGQFERSGIKSVQNDPGKAGFSHRARTRGINKRAVKSALTADGISNAGRKDEDVYKREIRDIINQVEKLEQQQQETILQQLGVTPLWYDNHTDIPVIIKKICGKALSNVN